MIASPRPVLHWPRLIGTSPDTPRARTPSYATPVITRTGHSAFCTDVTAADGTVWAWGYNGWGELGTGTAIKSSTKVPVPMTGLTGVTAIVASYYFGYALRSDGTILALGSNPYGQLGNGTTSDSSTPLQVTGLTGVTAIAAGYNFGYALQ